MRRGREFWCFLMPGSGAYHPSPKYEPADSLLCLYWFELHFRCLQLRVLTTCTTLFVCTCVSSLHTCVHTVLVWMCAYMCVHVSSSAQANDPGGLFLFPYPVLALKLTFPIRTDDLRGLEPGGPKATMASLEFWTTCPLNLGKPPSWRPGQHLGGMRCGS